MLHTLLGAMTIGSLDLGNLMAPERREAFAATNGTAQLEFLSTSDFPLASCLDGTPFGVYVRRAPVDASADARSGWIVALNGGGLCSHSADCQARTKTELGTSSVWPSTFALDSFAFFSSDARNPFRDWNMAFVPCASARVANSQPAFDVSSVRPSCSLRGMEPGRTE